MANELKHVERINGVVALKSSHPTVKKIKRDLDGFSYHGNKIWHSCYVLMDFLKQFPPEPQSKVIELGCGWGLLSAFVAKEFNAEVTGVDADANVKPFYELHAEVNGVDLSFKKKRFEQVKGKLLQGTDLVVGSDICFWDEMVDLLFNLINRAKKAGVKTVMISDPCRSPFTALATRCKKKYDKVEVIAKHLSRPVNASGEILIIDL